MYSIIPMPMIDWEEKNMKYILCFFPFVGAIIGGCVYGLTLLFAGSNAVSSFQGVALLLVPIIISGGIHLDGLLDTCDAFFSYGDREKKLEILKDPRTGAFGVIGAMVYFFALFGVYSQLLGNGYDYKMVLPFVFVISRTVGGMSMILVPNAKKDGLGASFANSSSQKIVTLVLGLWLIASFAILWVLVGILALLLVAVLGIFLLCIIPVYMKKFGGITGDLTGCMICSLELVLPLVIAIWGM